MNTNEHQENTGKERFKRSKAYENIFSLNEINTSFHDKCANQYSKYRDKPRNHCIPSNTGGMGNLALR